MSIYGINIPSPDEINYHADRQAQRVQAALQRLDPGDVLSILDARIAAESDPQAHPLYGLVLFLLDRTTACDGAQLYNDCRQRCLAAIDTCLDDALEVLED